MWGAAFASASACTTGVIVLFDVRVRRRHPPHKFNSESGAHAKLEPACAKPRGAAPRAQEKGCCSAGLRRQRREKARASAEAPPPRQNWRRSAEEPPLAGQGGRSCAPAPKAPCRAVLEPPPTGALDVDDCVVSLPTNEVLGDAGAPPRTESASQPTTPFAEAVQPLLETVRIEPSKEAIAEAAARLSSLEPPAAYSPSPEALESALPGNGLTTPQLTPEQEEARQAAEAELKDACWSEDVERILAACDQAEKAQVHNVRILTARMKAKRLELKCEQFQRVQLPPVPGEQVAPPGELQQEA